MIKTCKYCGKQFETSSGRRTVCYDRHYAKCAICGKEFEIHPPETVPKTCSSECRIKLMRKTCVEKYGTDDPGNLPQFRDKAKKTCLDRYGVDNVSKSAEVVSKIQKTFQDKYGVDNISQLDETKDKVKTTWKNKSESEIANISESRRQTCLDRYGVENPRQCSHIVEKVKATNRERYGVDYAIASDEVRKKSQATMLQRYGTINPNQLKIIQDKRKATCSKRFVAEHPFQSKEFLAKLRAHNKETTGYEWFGQTTETIQKRRDTNLSRYGVPAAFLLPENVDKSIEAMRNSAHSRISKLNRDFQDLLSSIGIESILEFRLENRFYDICIPSQNILIEIDPSYTHCVQGGVYKNIDKNYHREKSRLVAKYDYRCIHVFDWDDWEKVVATIYIPNRLFARNCRVEYITAEDCGAFMQTNHVQGTVSGQIACLGLLHEDQLVEAMSFGQPRYSKNYQWELLRLATSNGLQVIGGASKLFTAFVRDVAPESIISYCNLAKFTGTVYKKLGFKHIRDNAPTVWWSRGEKKVISNTLLLQRGYDQLFGTNYGKDTSNEELMLQHHWLPVYDCGQAVYVWTKQR